jgi:hypothetical protein
VPERATDVGDVGALLSTVRVAEKLPAAVGENTTVAATLAPGGIELRTDPFNEKADPPELMLALMMLRVAVPGLEISSICEDELPTVTCPNATDEGLIRTAG